MLFKRKRVIYIDVWVVIMERLKIKVSEDPPYKNCCTDCKYDKNLLCTQIKFSVDYRLVDLCGDLDNSILNPDNNYIICYRVLSHVKKEIQNSKEL